MGLPCPTCSPRDPATGEVVDQQEVGQGAKVGDCVEAWHHECVFIHTNRESIG